MLYPSYIQLTVKVCKFGVPLLWLSPFAIQTTQDDARLHETQLSQQTSNQPNLLLIGIVTEKSIDKCGFELQASLVASRLNLTKSTLALQDYQ